MRYLALATDYDGTLAHHGAVAPQTLEALQRLIDSGRKIILVTGRTLDDLVTVFPRMELFDLIVAENGAHLYDPKTRQETLLCERPNEQFIERLRAQGVQPLSVGKGIVATWTPHEMTVLEAIRDLGLELHVIFNKGAVMILPSGVNKASGLCAALERLELSPHNVVAVGDAENDHAFLSMCACSVAVANALEMLKQHSDLVTTGDHGLGVAELIEHLLADDLAVARPALARHDVLLGEALEGAASKEISIPPFDGGVLITGPSEAGKSTVTLGLIERICGHHYQFCLLDPEGDYQSFSHAVALGDATHPPSVEAVTDLLSDPKESVIVNLLAVPLADRPLFFSGLVGRMLDLRVRTGRPHWIVVDEAHHLFPASWVPASLAVPAELEGLVLITNRPDQIARSVLEQVTTVIALGGDPMTAVREFSAAAGKPVPFEEIGFELQAGEAAVWQIREGGGPIHVRATPSSMLRRRHTRKYAEGQLPPDRSFYFRGPAGKLNLRAYNLILFAQLAEGVDDETWEFHRLHGDYSDWFREFIKDEDLTREAEAVEHTELPPAQSRALLLDAIHRRYGGGAG